MGQQQTREVEKPLYNDTNMNPKEPLLPVENNPFLIEPKLSSGKPTRPYLFARRQAEVRLHQAMIRQDVAENRQWRAVARERRARAKGRFALAERFDGAAHNHNRKAIRLNGIVFQRYDELRALQRARAGR